MINITRKEECCGCKACGDICTKNSITFHTDEEGNWYPKVNIETCVDCGFCEKVCPILHPDFRNLGNFEKPETYILQASSLEDRLASASGAAYTLIVKAVYEKGGYIAGHIWKDKANVVGFVSGDPKDLDILRGTKYLQSDTEGMFKAVRSLLKDNKFVLFSGCPCQVAAMRRYLRKNYENLITTDFTCMGIDSPLAFAKYIESLEKQFGAEMVYFKAKAKDLGWRYLTNKARFANGRSYFGTYETDSNLKATFHNVLVRPSCYECKFKGLPRIADITIGDYWRKMYDYDPLDDNTGTSYAILNNAKASEFFKFVKSRCHYRHVNVTDILGANPRTKTSLPKPSYNRGEFYKRLQDEDFSSLVEDYHKRKYKVGELTMSNLKQAIRAVAKGLIMNLKKPLSAWRFLYYNFISRSIATNVIKGDVLFATNVKMRLSKRAKVIIKGRCILGDSTGTTYIHLFQGSTLKLDTNTIESGSIITLLPNSNVKIGYRSVLGHNVIIKTQTGVNIGDFSLIHDSSTINDTDCGVIIFDTIQPYNKIINIGTHVLVGQGSIIKGATTIGDEVILKEYSVVKGNITHNSTIAGNPAHVIDNNKCWKYNF